MNDEAEANGLVSLEAEANGKAKGKGSLRMLPTYLRIKIEWKA